jgi:uncharacterized protein YjiS (DUF1127 family)
MITDTPNGARYSASFKSSMSAAIQAIAAMLRFRRRLNALSALDDRLLQDIGLTRSDLIELRTASSIDAVNALSRISLRR